MREIHLWVPGIADTGGIQHYSWCLAKALRDLHPEARILVFSRRDKQGYDPGIPGVSVHGFGSWPKLAGHIWFSLVGFCYLIFRRPDMCIATHPAFAKVLCWGPTLGIPCLASAHGIDVWGDALKQIRGALARMTGILPVSRFTQNVLIEEGGLDPKRIRVVPDTFKEEAFSPGVKPEYLLRRHGLHADQPVLLTVGRLAAAEAYKGQDQVIAALPAIRARHPDLRYIIAGTGDDEARLRQCAKDHGQDDAVIFAGFVSDAELPDYYRLCDAFVMPSTGEGFGIVYLEALATGKPCIVGDRDASPEAIVDGKLGFVIDPRSPRDIADAVVRLVSHEHDKPWLSEPETLRREVMERYGFASFKQSLQGALGALLPR